MYTQVMVSITARNARLLQIGDQMSTGPRLCKAA